MDIASAPLAELKTCCNLPPALARIALTRLLFRAQRDHRIDACRALRRNQRPDQRASRNQRCPRQIGQRIASADAEQRILYTVSRNDRETECQSQTECQSD